jgi:hypothetical protein
MHGKQYTYIESFWYMRSSKACSSFDQAKRNVDPSELEEYLDTFLVTQFNTEADDESPYEVLNFFFAFYLVT